MIDRLIPRDKMHSFPRLVPGRPGATRVDNRNHDGTGDHNMRQAIGFLLVLAIGVASAAQQAEPDKEKTPDYYPLKPGTKWFYQVEVNGQKIKLTSQIAKLENIDGKSLALVESLVNGNVTATEHLTTTDKGVFRNRSNGVEISPPVCLLKYPYKKGDTWESETTLGNQQMKVKGKSVDTVEVTVAAGKYKAVRADAEITVGGMSILTSYWFAPDVGVVKQITDLNGMKISVELEKYEAAK
jgi:hypothetical protein